MSTLQNVLVREMLFNEKMLIKISNALFYRSGSSFLSEMLSLSPSSLHVFEPLRTVKRGSSALERWGQQERERAPHIIEGIFECDEV